MTSSNSYTKAHQILKKHAQPLQKTEEQKLITETLDPDDTPLEVLVRERLNKIGPVDTPIESKTTEEDKDSSPKLR